MGYIYIIKNSINHKVYIGQTIQKVQDRWNRHCQKSISNIREETMAIKRAIRKYGRENFEFVVLETCDNDKLDEREIYWINKYNSYENGYNLTRGGKSSTKPLKIDKAEYQVIIELYLQGLSLRYIAKEYRVDKHTIKNVLLHNNISIRKKRIYKYSQEIINEILEKIGRGVSRKVIMDSYKISKGYLSHLISTHRI